MTPATVTTALKSVRATTSDAGAVCPLCGGQSSWPLPYNAEDQFEQEHGAQLRRAGYSWYLCRTCGNGYPSFVPDLEVLSAYWARNRDVSEPGSEGQVWKNRKRISRIGAERSFKMFSPLVGDRSGRRFLDIACGLGATVRRFADDGWDAQGIDADVTMRRFHEGLGIKSQIGQIETVKPSGTFDLIQIAHAIYFVTDPLAFLVRVKCHLTEGGVLAVVLADFLASDDLGLPGYPHSFFPTASSMRYLLAQAGYRVIMCRALSGSIFLAARPGAAPLPRVQPWLIRLGYQTKSLRYALVGRPKLASRRLAKSLISFVRHHHPST